MKKRILSIVVLAAMTVLPMGVFAAVPVVKTVEAEAKVVTSATISNATTVGGTGGSNLNFGTVSVSGTNGSVLLTAAASPTVTPTNVSTVGGGQTAAVFTVGGEVNASVTVTIPTTITVKKDGSSTTDQMIITTNNSLSSTTFNLTTGSQTFYIGGSLAVGSAQVAGDYSANFDVSVAYN